MRRRRRTGRPERSGRVIAALLVGFFAGALTVWWLREKGPPRPIATTVPTAADSEHRTGPAVVTAPERWVSAPPSRERGAAIKELQSRDLRLPIDGADVESLKGAFEQRRGADRPHEAVDILAPRHTPVHAVDDGTIAKLFFSKAGGNTIYQFDPSGRFCYYYAHLERYADRVRDGGGVTRADILGYVGTSGNAAPDAPHLHFMIFELTPERHWWQGTAIDPYLVFHKISG